MTGPPTPQSFLNTPTQSVNSTTPGTSPTITPPTPATTASLDQNLSTNVSASNSTPDPEIVEDFEPTAEVSGVVHNEGQLPLQSCYCVVCLKCFFCLKVRYTTVLEEKYLIDMHACIYTYIALSQLSEHPLFVQRQYYSFSSTDATRECRSDVNQHLQTRVHY